jgi:hypothetical protein
LKGLLILLLLLLLLLLLDTVYTDMTFIDRILRKPSSFFLWLFTSIIVTNTLLLVLTAGPAAPREQPGQPEEDPAGEQKQTKRQKEKKKTTTTVSKSRDELTRKELFDVLSDVSDNTVETNRVLYFTNTSNRRRDCIRIWTRHGNSCLSCCRRRTHRVPLSRTSTLWRQ